MSKNNKNKGSGNKNKKLYKHINWEKVNVVYKKEMYGGGLETETYNGAVTYGYKKKPIEFVTPVVKIPFGVEWRVNETCRVTLEYSSVESSCFQFIKKMEAFIIQSLSNQTELDLGELEFKSTLLEAYRIEDKYGPLQTRVRIKQAPKTGIMITEFKDPAGFNIESAKVKGKLANVSLSLKNVWITKDGKYGLNWETRLVSLVYG